MNEGKSWGVSGRKQGAFVKTVAETLSELAAAGGAELWSRGGCAGYSSLRTAGAGCLHGDQ